MKSILFFLLLLSSNLLSAQEYKDYFTIKSVPSSPISNYHIKLKDGLAAKDSAGIDGFRWINRQDSLVSSSLQKKLTELLRNEVIDKYNLKEFSLRIEITCNKEGHVSDCGFAIAPENLQHFPESLLLKIYSLFKTEVEPAFLKKIIDEFWKKAPPNEKRRTGHTRLLVSIKIDTEKKQLGIRWFS